MQTDYNTIIFQFLILLTLCVLAQMLSQNTPHFIQTAHDYGVTASESLPLFWHNI